MVIQRCPYCGLACLCGVGFHIAHTEVCLDRQIMAVLFETPGSDSESLDPDSDSEPAT